MNVQDYQRPQTDKVVGYLTYRQEYPSQVLPRV